MNEKTYRHAINYFILKISDKNFYLSYTIFHLLLNFDRSSVQVVRSLIGLSYILLSKFGLDLRAVKKC